MAYAKFYGLVPFMRRGVPGCGFFAVNTAGRAKWGAFPDIISDDTFVRLSFAPEERHAVDAPYNWPVVEGFFNLVKVRRRQDVGVREVAEKFPQLQPNDDKVRFTVMEIIRAAMRHPVGFLCYGAVALAVRMGGDDEQTWSRGR